MYLRHQKFKFKRKSKPLLGPPPSITQDRCPQSLPPSITETLSKTTISPNLQAGKKKSQPKTWKQKKDKRAKSFQ